MARCLALAERLRQNGWHPIFATRPETLEVFPSLGESFPLVILSDGDEAGELRHASPDGCDLLIVDHYHRDAMFEGDCRPWARTILVIDDLANRRHDADFLLDQTPGRQPNDYAALVAPSCRLLMGSDYALLRPEFARLRGGISIRKSVRSVLLGFGATDPCNTTAVALQAVLRSKLDVRIDVVIGKGDKRAAEINEIASPLGNVFHLHQETPDLGELMASADLAIGAGGITALERCCLGLPSIVIQIADNQHKLASVLSAAGAIIDLGPADSNATNTDTLAKSIRALADAPARLSAMSRCAYRVCDGRGTWRAALALLDLRPTAAGPITLRLATESDAKTLFAWQTPGARRFSRNPQAPNWDEHNTWLARVLTDPGRLLMIIEVNARPVGMLRLDGIASRPEVSIVVAPECQGQGVGKSALGLAAELLPYQTIDASVHPNNSASHGLFRACGYDPVGPDLYRLAPRIYAGRHASVVTDGFAMQETAVTGSGVWTVPGSDNAN